MIQYCKIINEYYKIMDQYCKIINQFNIMDQYCNLEFFVFVI